jgi:putative protease
VDVTLDCRRSQCGTIVVSAQSEDGRIISTEFECGNQVAENRERMAGMFANQIGKSAGHYQFNLTELISDGYLPFMSASALNGIRRSLAEELDKHCCQKKDILHRKLGRKVENDRPSVKDVTYKQNISNMLSEQIYTEVGAHVQEKAFELTHRSGAELMRTRYCIKYELGICPIHQKALASNLPAHLRDIKPSTRLFLLNNGRRLALHFDCANCEMTLTL